MQPRTAGSLLCCTITGFRTVKGPQPVLRTKERARKSCSERLASCSSPGCLPLWEDPQGQKGPVPLRPRDPGPLYLPATCGPSHAFQINTESAPSLSVARPPEARAMWLSVDQTGAGLSGAGACFQPEAAVAGHTGADRAPGPPGARAVGLRSQGGTQGCGGVAARTERVWRRASGGHGAPPLSSRISSPARCLGVVSAQRTSASREALFLGLYTSWGWDSNPRRGVWGRPGLGRAPPPV